MRRALQTLLLVLAAQACVAQEKPVAFVSSASEIDALAAGTTRVRAAGIDDALLTRLCKVRGIVELQLAPPCRFSGAALAELQKMDKLEALEFEYLPKADADAIKHIGALSRLAKLKFTCAYLPEDVRLRELAGLKGLRELTLDVFSTDPSAFKFISELDKLEYLAWRVPGDVPSFPPSMTTLMLESSGLTLDAALVANLASLKKLSTLGLAAVSRSDKDALARLKTIKSLEHLTIAYDAGLGDVLTPLLESNSLRTLKVRTNVLGESAAVPLAKQEMLERLELEGVQGATLTEPLVAAVAALKKLRHLRIRAFKGLDGAALKRIAAMKDLQSLRLEWCLADVSDEAAQHVGNLANLSCLELTGTSRLGDGTAKAVSTLPSLQTLILTHSAISASALESIGKVRGLKELNLSENAGLANADFAPLAALDKLERLSLERLAGEDASCEADLAALRTLRNLRHVTFGGARLTAAQSAFVTALPLLVTVDLEGCAVTDETLAALGKAQHLKELRLGSAQGASDKGLEALSASRSLVLIGFYNATGLTDAGVAHLARIPTLETLQLHWCVQLSDAALTSFRNHKRLRELALSGLENVTAASLPILASLPVLAVLTMNSTGMQEYEVHQACKGILVR